MMAAIEDRVDKDGQRNRIPLLAAYPDRGVDNIAEHFAWHERLLLLTVFVHPSRHDRLR